MEKRQAVKRAMLLILAAGVLLAAAAFLAWRSPATPAFLRTPSPNGYQTLLSAAAALGGAFPSDITNNVAEFLAGQQRTFELISKAREQSAEAPAYAYEFSAAMQMMRDMMDFRRLADALVLRSKFLIQQNQIALAADTLLEAVRLGQQVERGPLICFMVGSAIELRSTRKLDQLVPSLATSDLPRVLAEIHQTNRKRFPYEEIEKRERYYGFLTLPAMVRNYPLKSLQALFSGEGCEALRNGRERYLNTVALQKLLAGQIASELFSREQHRSPVQISELVPRYLSELLDPHSGKPLLMRTSGTNTFLYSVGPNGLDERGAKDDISLPSKDDVGMKMLMNVLSHQ